MLAGLVLGARACYEKAVRPGRLPSDVPVSAPVMSTRAMVRLVPSCSATVSLGSSCTLILVSPSGKRIVRSIRDAAGGGDGSEIVLHGPTYLFLRGTFSWTPFPRLGSAGLCHTPEVSAGLCHTPEVPFPRMGSAGLCHTPEVPFPRMGSAGLCHTRYLFAELCHTPDGGTFSLDGVGRIMSHARGAFSSDGRPNCVTA